MTVTTLAPWYGSARLLAQHVGIALEGCNWVGIPCAGGMPELLTITARTVVVNDIHRHLMNLAHMVSDPVNYVWLRDQLELVLYHPDVLAEAQQLCRSIDESKDYPSTLKARRNWAAAYFICCWMTRSASAGTPSELTGSLSLRWEAAGGDSNVRFRSAIESLDLFHQAMVDRCTFSTLDVFAFLDKCKDRPDHGIYVDPPFLTAGLKYSHNPGRSEQEDWHRRLSDRLKEFQQTRIVVRAHDSDLLWSLYGAWDCQQVSGRKQTNETVTELLLTRNVGGTDE